MMEPLDLTLLLLTTRHQWRKRLVRAFMFGAVSAVALMLSTDLFAQQSQTGTAQDAQAC
jgi:hypothetical protein